MKILITGATGLVGTALFEFLRTQGHEVNYLSRPEDWDPKAGVINLSKLEGFDAVIHLAGENIASGRWTKSRKKQIFSSRVKGTRLLAESFKRLKHPPKVLVSASAIGYYGDRGNEVLTERSTAGAGFLAEVCQAWESEAQVASSPDLRVVSMRIGVVLSSAGGALARMLPLFRFGLGGRLGSGHQYMSWITLSDLCRAFHHAAITESLHGAVNAASPHPVTNREFTTALSAMVRRPAPFPVPRLGLRMALGELADALLLASTRAIPEKLMASGFRFEDSDIRLALAKNVSGLSRLQYRQFISRSVDDVFPFFASAENLDRITPGWLKFGILNPNVAMRRGALVDYKLRLHGIPIRWRSEICDWEPPYRFVDVQVRGPYSVWVHEHRFHPVDGGTLVEDSVWYAAPGGKFIGKLFVDSDLHRVFEYRRASLAELFS